jgi:hypothetical protein
MLLFGKLFSDISKLKFTILRPNSTAKPFVVLEKKTLYVELKQFE